MKVLVVFMLVLMAMTVTFPSFAQDSLNVTMIGGFNTPDNAIVVEVSGNYAYVADDHTGIRVIDIDNPMAAQEISFWIHLAEPLV